jgi:nitrite reductase/ring-hydroxylating ferredoxin subunit
MTACVEGRYIAVFHVDGAFHALDGNCPHQGGVLPRKEVQLISLAFHCACTTLDEAARGAISSNDQRR